MWIFHSMAEFLLDATGGLTPRPEQSVFLLIGLLGGAHCLGMCGPLVTLYSDRLGDDPDRADWREIRQHLLFNCGRTVSYAVIGALMGALGQLVFDAAAVASVADTIRGAVGIGVGLGIVLVGVGYTLKGTASMPNPIPRGGTVFSRIAARMRKHVDKWVAGPRIVGLGMLHGLLPCPILYPAFLYAFAIGSPVDGFVSLALLGVGTFPTLFAYGVALHSLGSQNRQRLHRVLGIVFVVLGYLPLSMGLASLGIEIPQIDIPIYQPLG